MAVVGGLWWASIACGVCVCVCFDVLTGEVCDPFYWGWVSSGLDLIGARIVCRSYHCYCFCTASLEGLLLWHFLFFICDRK